MDEVWRDRLAALQTVDALKSADGRVIEPVSVKALSDVISETKTYSSVMAAFGSAPVNGTIVGEAKTTILQYLEYVLLSRPDSPGISSCLPTIMRELANGEHQDLSNDELAELVKQRTPYLMGR